MRTEKQADLTGRLWYKLGSRIPYLVDVGAKNQKFAFAATFLAE